MTELSQYVKPEFAVLVAVLYCLGIALKHIEYIPDRCIPLVLTLCGIVLAGLSVMSRYAEYANAAGALFDMLVQGILCAGMSVYVNQIVKQAGNSEKK